MTAKKGAERFVCLDFVTQGSKLHAPGDEIELTAEAAKTLLANKKIKRAKKASSADKE